MRRYDARDITEQHYRTLRLLIALGQAEAHIVVKAKRPWPPSVAFSPRQRATCVPGEAIN